MTHSVAAVGHRHAERGQADSGQGRGVSAVDYRAGRYGSSGGRLLAGGVRLHGGQSGVDSVSYKTV